MNKRIQELAEQCTVSCIDGRGVELNEIDVEKFAELIVEECLFIIDDERKPEMVSRIELWKQVKQHFGVEE
jgi:hypothetical protein